MGWYEGFTVVVGVETCGLGPGLVGALKILL